jgi:hypothetical protein
LILQITPVFELPVTVATYWDEVPSTTLVAPVRLSVTGGGGGGGAEASATVRLRATVESARLVAVIITVDDGGALAGAV